MNKTKRLRMVHVILFTILFLVFIFALRPYASEKYNLKDQNEYTVTFELNDEAEHSEEERITVNVKAGEKIAPKPKEPKRDGYEFAGWTVNDDNAAAQDRIFWDFRNGTVEDSITLWASWDLLEDGLGMEAYGEVNSLNSGQNTRAGNSEWYTVRFNRNDGKAYTDGQLQKRIVKPGEKIKPVPADPKREGYEFTGWVINGEDAPEDYIYWDFDNMDVDEDMTLWAGWDTVYTIAFNPNDGKEYASSELNKVIVRPGEKITQKPADPVRKGYEFTGWVINGEDVPEDYIYWDFDNMEPDDNITLWASWDTYYTVVFDLNDGMNYPYAQMDKAIVKHGEKITEKPEDPERAGYDFAGWVIKGRDENPANYIDWDFDNMVVEHNITLWASWNDNGTGPFEETWHTILFDRNDGINYSYGQLQKRMVKDGKFIAPKPEDPKRTGYVFAGWVINGGDEDPADRIYWDFDKMIPEHNLTLWASWDEIYTIVFDPNDGVDYLFTEMERVTVPPGALVTQRPADPVRDGYEFAGWVINGGDEDPADRIFWDFDKMPAEHNTTLWAAWDPYCTVVFDLNDGPEYPYEQMDKVRVKQGERITGRPADPTRAGYVFAGWVINGGDEDPADRIYWDFDNMPVEHNTTLWAAWDLAYTVAFDRNDGIIYTYDQLEKRAVKAGEKITQKPADPVRAGYLFGGWTINSNNVLPEDRSFWDFENMSVVRDITLYASWDLPCVVAFDRNDGIAYTYDQLYKVEVKAKRKITEKPADPERAGYLFAGWTTNSNNTAPEDRIFWDFDNRIVENDMILYASWDVVYTVVFDRNDGIAYTEDQLYKILVRPGQKVTPRPEDPERAGYLFAGWTINSDNQGEKNRNFWDFDNMTAEGDMILYASWDPVYTVAFNRNDGITYTYDQLKKVKVKNGDRISAVEWPIRIGYMFKGWMLYNVDPETAPPVYWDFDRMTVERDTILWAAWERIDLANPGGSGGGSTKPGRGRLVAGESKGMGEGTDEIIENTIPKGPAEIPEAESSANNAGLKQVPKTGDIFLIKIFCLSVVSVMMLFIIIVLTKKKFGKKK